MSHEYLHEWLIGLAMLAIAGLAAVLLTRGAMMVDGAEQPPRAVCCCLGVRP